MPGAATLRESKILESMVKKQAADNQPYAAICAAPAVALGSWGLLKGLKVRKKYMYSTFVQYNNQFKVISNNFMISNGVSEMTLFLSRQLATHHLWSSYHHLHPLLNPGFSRMAK